MLSKHKVSSGQLSEMVRTEVCTTENFCSILRVKMLKLQVNIRDDWSKGQVGEEGELVDSQNSNQKITFNQQLCTAKRESKIHTQ